MSMYQVSDENLQKVEKYFVEKVKQTGDKTVEATVLEIAEGSGVALATAHKAIKQLAQEKRITIIKPKSRRFAIKYTYNSSIEGFEQNESMEEQIAYLSKMVMELTEKNAILQHELNETRGIVNICRNKMRQAGIEG